MSTFNTGIGARTDDTLGMQVGRVTRLAPSGQVCWYSVDAGYERGPARLPIEVQHAAIVAGGDVTTVTPDPLRVGQMVTVLATHVGQYVVARY